MVIKKVNMLYGNLIFIKKTGGDGSKYPVTERNIKIGRSENCLIRIYNPQVALEHCQLIIEDNGQATLRNLSNQSILNGKPLNNGDITLCHGDIFKLGERLARWEYLPTSKFYKQLLSPTGRLVAVVMPQQRSLGDQATPGTSASEVSVLKNTPLGKRRFSERATLENSSSVKIRKSSGSELIHKGKGDLPKLMNSHHNLKSTRWMLKGGKVKERKSISGVVGSKAPKEKVEERYRKSTLPSWKVNFVSPSSRKSSGSRNSLIKSNEKSKLPKDTAQILLNDMIESKPEKLLLSDSETDVKRPQKIILESNSSDDSVKSTSKTVLKKSVVIEKESPLNFSKRSKRSSCSLSQSAFKKSTVKSPSKVDLSTPKQKPSLKFGRSVHSESKLTSKKYPLFFKGARKMSLILKKVESTPRQSFNKRRVNQRRAETSKIKMSDVSNEIMLTSVKNNEVVLTKEKEGSRKSLKNTPSKRVSKKTENTLRKSLINKNLKTPDVKRKTIISKTPKSLTKEQSKTPKFNISEKVALDTVSQTPLIDLDDATSPKKRKFCHQKSTTAKSPTLGKKTPAKLIKNLGETELSSSGQKIQNKISSASSSIDRNFNFSAINSAQLLTSPRSRNSVISKKAVSSSKAGNVFSRGGRRKLSPSSSAERAAKKLKISCPKKPDKNKKAALLVLGKANRKQQVSQNVKVLLRQKILKKAIKQSTAVSALEDKIGVRAAIKSKESLAKNASKLNSEKFRNKDESSENSRAAKYLEMSDETIVKPSTEEKVLEETPKSKKIFATKVIQTLPRLSTDATVQSVSKQSKQSEFSRSVNSDSFIKKTNSPSNVFEKGAENYLFSSNRRCSKRLSYKNDTGRPDFIELSPTALGLIPKNVEIFKTPKDNKRRSSSLVTPKNVQTAGIIKSASTSKIGNRKSVRFSSKDVSINSEFCSPSISERIDFNFSPFDTPNITVDVFVSPLMDQSAVLKHDLNESNLPEVEKISSNSIKNRKSTVHKTFVRELQFPSSKKKFHKIFSNSSAISPSSSASLPKSLSSKKVEKQSKTSDQKKSRKSNLIDVRQLFSSPKNQKSPRNSLSDLTGIPSLLRTPKDIKSPKNDLTDVRGVKKLMRTPKVQKSPKNDLTDVRGVKKLMRTPRVQKSPKNDLTDVRGVKKLMRTPKVQKSPKNDLTDVRGVKKLMQTPKVQKSPKNDLTDVRGVKKLMRTPKVQKSPKNDLTDVRGVKKLMQTPKVQKSPKNDLTDVRGVKKLMQTPKVQKSPKNDLTDIVEVKRLLRNSRIQKDPKNELPDLRGIKKLLRSPKLQKSSKNDLDDLTGVKELLKTPRGQKSPKNSLLEISEIKKLFESSAVQQHSKNSLEDGKVLSSQSEDSLNSSLLNAEMKQLLISKSPKSVLKSKKTVTRKSHVKDFRPISGRRAVYSLSKGPKNDLSDVTGVRELFSKHKPTNDYNTSLIGVAEFEYAKTEEAFEQKVTKFRKRLVPESVQKVSKTRTLRPKKALKNEIKTKSSARLRLRKGVEEEINKEPTNGKKSEAVMNVKKKKPIKRKTENKISGTKKALAIVKKSQKLEKITEPRGKKLPVKTKMDCLEEQNEIRRSSRKRKVLLKDITISPPKLRRKVPASEESTYKTGETSTAISRPKRERPPKKETSVKSVREIPMNVRNNETATVVSEIQLKTATEISTKQNQKVQNKRSQTKSKKNDLNDEKKVNPRKTRSHKATSATQKISKTLSKMSEKKVFRSTTGKEKLSPMVRKSARRK